MGKWKGNGKPALITGGLICLHNDQDNLSKNSELKHLFLKHCNFLQFFSFLVSGEVWSCAGLASAAAKEHGWRGCKVKTHPQSVFLQLLIITRMFFKSMVLQSRKAIGRHDFPHP